MRDAADPVPVLLAIGRRLASIEEILSTEKPSTGPADYTEEEAARALKLSPGLSGRRARAGFFQHGKRITYSERHLEDYRRRRGDQTDPSGNDLI